MPTAILVAQNQYLSGNISDIQARLLNISEQRRVIAYMTSVLSSELADSDPEAILSEDPTYLQFQYNDRQLEQEQKTWETQLKVQQAQQQSIEKQIDTDIQKSFKIGFAQGGG